MRTKTIAAVALSTLLLGSAAFAQNTPNSGAGQPGLPGNKSGPTQTPSGAASGTTTTTTTPQDTSGIQGKPGNKSGPSVRPPKTE